jgi:DNA processing protein
MGVYKVQKHLTMLTSCHFSKKVASCQYFNLFLMIVNMLTVTDSDYPGLLGRLPQPPEQVYIRGDLLSLLKRPRVAIVGSRSLSAYGRETTHKLTTALANQGVVIVSGLALGVDSVAHKAAVEAGGQTIAVLPAGVETPYPRSHNRLAEDILKKGGALISEYPADAIAWPANFLARNRIIAALSDVVLVTEAAARSGSLNTARYGMELGLDVLAVPGNIYSPTSEGTNNLIKTGALPATRVEDILQLLGLESSLKQGRAVPKVGDSSQQKLIDLLATGHTDGAELLDKSQLDVAAYNQALTMLEISGTVRPLGANHWSLS